MKQEQEKIDFVISWVDGNDKKWREEKNKYSGEEEDSTNSDVRFRDWENLKYWFRGVEKFAPWVNKVHFVTYGHLPEWLNTKHPKLNIVKHEEYIPEEYLPTFSSHTIELNLHRIKDLSEKFVYFNDDMFLIDKVKEEDFFFKGLPKDSFAENVLIATGKKDVFPHILLSNMDLINRNFNKRLVMKKNVVKYINPKYGSKNFRTIILSGWNLYSNIYNTHIATSYCKNTFYEVWQKENDVLDATCRNKFRTESDVNQYVFRMWQLLTGNFSPRRFGFGEYFTLGNNNENVYQTIAKQKRKVICINDGFKVDFEKVKPEVIYSFEKILPEKSEFEI